VVEGSWRDYSGGDCVNIIALVRQAIADKDKPKKKKYERVRKHGNKLKRGIERHKYLEAAPKKRNKRLSGSEKRRRKAGHRPIIKRKKDGSIIKGTIPMISTVEK